MRLYTEGGKCQSDEKSRVDCDVPRTVSSVGVNVGMLGTGECTLQTRQTTTTGWNIFNILQH